MSIAAARPTLCPEALYQRRAGGVRRALRRLGVGAADADDLTQEVFVTLHRRGIAFADERVARSWLYGVARRLASNYRRARMRRAERERYAPPPLPLLAPDAHVEQHEVARVIREFEGRLSSTARDVFRLSEVDGMSGPDVARALGLPLNTTYSHIRRIRRRLARVAVAVLALALLVMSMLAGNCATERADDRPRVTLRAAADARA